MSNGELGDEMLSGSPLNPPAAHKMCIAHSSLRCASSLRGADGTAESCLEEGLSTNSGCLHSGVYLGRVAPELPRRRKPYCFPSALAKLIYLGS